MERVTVKQYIIIVVNFDEEGSKQYYSYSTLKEAENYYVLYKNALKDCRLTLVAVLKEDIL